MMRNKNAIIGGGLVSIIAGSLCGYYIWNKIRLAKRYSKLDSVGFRVSPVFKKEYLDNWYNIKYKDEDDICLLSRTNEKLINLACFSSLNSLLPQMLETFLCDKYSIMAKRTIREHVKNNTSLTMIIYSKSKKEIRCLHIVCFDEVEEGVKELIGDKQIVSININKQWDC